MDQPFVSVIMPTFNQSEYIDDAIASVLEQSYRHFELIVIDNYSRDSTEKIVTSIPDDRVSYYKFSNNGIIAASRNFGIQKAKGDLVAFIDSDDRWYTHKLLRQIREMTTYPEIALCYSPFIIESQDKQYNGKIRTFRANYFSKDVYERLLNGNFIVASSVLVRANILAEEGLFDESPDLIGAEDFDLWLRIARNHRISCTQGVEGAYRLHSTNCGSSIERITKPLNVIDKHLSLNWISRKKARCAKAYFYFREGWVFISKNTGLARSYFFKALQLSSGNLKIVCLNLGGIVFSMFPWLHHFMRETHLDTKISRKFLSTQNT